MNTTYTNRERELMDKQDAKTISINELLELRNIKRSNLSTIGLTSKQIGRS